MYHEFAECISFTVGFCFRVQAVLCVFWLWPFSLPVLYNRIVHAFLLVLYYLPSCLLLHVGLFHVGLLHVGLFFSDVGTSLSLYPDAHPFASLATSHRMPLLPVPF